MKSIKKIIILFTVLSLIIFAGCTSVNENNTNIKKVAPNGETKTVNLSFGSEMVYTPSEIRVKAGTKVIIEGDTKTLIDGMDTIIIEGYDLSKKIKEGDNKLEFIADVPGEFEIHCENQMGNGKLIVEE